MEAEGKSSHYGLDMLGYTCATKVNTNRYKNVSLNKTVKITPVRIIDCNSSIWSRNR